MTIQEIAKHLDDCALKRVSVCADCKHRTYKGIENCQAELIVEMAEECRKLAEQMEDDGK